MPHLRLEYTDVLPKDIASRELLLRLHHELHRVIGVRLENCKSRAIPLSRYAVGDGAGDQTFVHLHVTVLEGRSPEARTEAAEALLGVLLDACRDCGHEPQITVEVGEIVRRFYAKHPPGTLTPVGRDRG